ncbi:MAG: polynucleotide adenylyltransferase PcnB [Treponema sp.]|nr:polynucleotide adenylyltransferase PcnB [Treponema sp.]
MAVTARSGKRGILLIRYGKEENGSIIKKALVYTREEHGIDPAAVDSEAVFITGRLRANGHESYLVGGSVRDLILGKKPKDFDIVTSATPARIKKLFRNSRIIGRRFRLVHVFFGPRVFEVSTFRSLKDGHSSNTYGTIDEDALRRDFSFNALYYDPGRQTVVDYVGGLADIKKKRLRPLIPPGVIFKDDPVRMIRALKYAAVSDFKVPWLLLRRIKKESPLLAEISPSRLTEEMVKIVNSSAAAVIVESLDNAGIYGYLQKEAAALMKRDPLFRKKYLESLARDCGSDESGRSLSAMVRDYLEITRVWETKPRGPLSKAEETQWAARLVDNFKTAFFEVRRFLLPVNPPKLELEKAVRMIFAEHGLEVRKTRLFDRPRRPKSAEALPAAGPETAVRAVKKRRRRRGRKPGAAAEKRIES